MAAEPAQSAPRSFEPRCWWVLDQGVGVDFIDDDSVGNNGTWAKPGYEKTDTGSNDTESTGWNFPHDADKQMQCSFIVPQDYDSSSSTKPVLRIMGWSVTDDICELDPVTRTVVLGVSHRSLTAGGTAAVAWTTEITGTINFACVGAGCSGGLDCNQSDVVRQTTIDAVGSTSDWSADELVMIRVQRKTASDDLVSAFHLSSVQVQYDNVD